MVVHGKLTCKARNEQVVKCPGDIDIDFSLGKMDELCKKNTYWDEYPILLGCNLLCCHSRNVFSDGAVVVLPHPFVDGSPSAFEGFDSLEDGLKLKTTCEVLCVVVSTMEHFCAFKFDKVNREVKVVSSTFNKRKKFEDQKMLPIAKELLKCFGWRCGDIHKKRRENPKRRGTNDSKLTIELTIELTIKLAQLN